MTDSKPAHISSPTRPPERLFWLGVAFLALSLLGWARLQQSIATWEVLAGVMRPALLFYLAASGAAWGLVGLAPALGLLLRWRRVKPVASAVAVIFPAAYWLDRLLLSRSPERLANGWFMLGATVIWLGYVGVVLYSRATRLFLEGRYEQTG